MVSGQWSVVSGQWSVVSGQWSVVSGQWSVVSGCSFRVNRPHVGARYIVPLRLSVVQLVENSCKQLTTDN